MTFWRLLSSNTSSDKDLHYFITLVHLMAIFRKLTNLLMKSAPMLEAFLKHVQFQDFFFQLSKMAARSFISMAMGILHV